MLRVITVNLNGIRSAAQKGFFAWLEKQNADVVCIQETKAQAHQLPEAPFYPKGYHSYYFDAEKKGYSGVALYTKVKPLTIRQGLGWGTADQEGRYLQADYKNLSVASLYLPSGTSGEERQNIKFNFLELYLEHLKSQIKSKHSFILCGDWNIAHQKMDLKNWKSNQKSSGFLPEERAWMEHLFKEVGFIDAFRYKNPTLEAYTWWSHRARAWENNVGWRIDYQVITPDLKDRILNTEIYREQKFSDHAPLTIDYDCTISA